MNKTCHSEYLPLESVYLSPAENSFESSQKLEEQWKELNYLDLPDFHEALKEYKLFEKLVRNSSAQVLKFEPNLQVQIDAIYCRDASIATDFGLIICNMGKGGRVNEPQHHLNTFKKDDIYVLGAIEAPGTIEGGDVAWLDRKTLAVGHTYRTNTNGIEQLKALLEPKGVEIIVADLPHYKGQNDVFHLMSILSPVDKDLAVVYSPLMPIRFREELLKRGFELIEVPDKEFESMGCNVLAVVPRLCIMVEGNPMTKKRLEIVGCEVMAYKGHEISVKGGGGPTCLTRPLQKTYK